MTKIVVVGSLCLGAGTQEEEVVMIRTWKHRQALLRLGMLSFRKHSSGILMGVLSEISFSTVDNKKKLEIPATCNVKGCF